MERWKEHIVNGNVHNFYISIEWREIRAEVLRLDKYECQIHKAKGKYKKAEIVHHTKHARDFPDLALSIYYYEEGEKKRNLISVCKYCHETVCHPERMKNDNAKKNFTNEERW